MRQDQKERERHLLVLGEQEHMLLDELFEKMTGRV